MTNIYNNGKIYKLINTDNTLCYIGSTTKTLEQRKSKHERNYKSWKTGGHNYVTSFKVIEDDIDGLNIFLLENVTCNSKEELLARERYYIDTIQCVNKNMPNRTLKEYRIENFDKIKERKKKFYHKNIDTILQKKGSPHLYDQYQKSKSGGALIKKQRRAPTQRSLLVKKVMSDRGLSMIKASQYIKENDLY